MRGEDSDGRGVDQRIRTATKNQWRRRTRRPSHPKKEAILRWSQFFFHVSAMPFWFVASEEDHHPRSDNWPLERWGKRRSITAVEATVRTGGWPPIPPPPPPPKITPPPPYPQHSVLPLRQRATSTSTQPRTRIDVSSTTSTIPVSNARWAPHRRLLPIFWGGASVQHVGAALPRATPPATRRSCQAAQRGFSISLQFGRGVTSSHPFFFNGSNSLATHSTTPVGTASTPFALPLDDLSPQSKGVATNPSQFRALQPPYSFHLHLTNFISNKYTLFYSKTASVRTSEHRRPFRVGVTLR